MRRTHAHVHAHHRRRHRRPLTLHRVLFFGGFASIAATAAAVIFVVGLTNDSGAWWTEMNRFRTFASGQLARIWVDDAERTRLLSDAARDLHARIEATDAAGHTVFAGGLPGTCDNFAFRFDVTSGAEKLGAIVACRPGEHGPPWRGALALAAALSALWIISAIFARKAARPIRHLVDVARRIGEGDLRARPTIGRHSVVEVRALADALSEMADRIEKQLKDQRALLAGASHEMRTPLGHLRILVELLRANASPKVVDDIEREVVEMDALIEKLLASSRLDFSLAEKRDVDARDLALRALERASLPASLLACAEPAGQPLLRFRGDPTLLLGAIGNLLENAKTHGAVVVALTVEARDDEIAFVVDDGGKGIAAADEEKVFEPFFHKGDMGTLGLGLSLVKRIAEAHGGRSFATTRAEGGGRVGFTVARAAS